MRRTRCLFACSRRLLSSGTGGGRNKIYVSRTHEPLFNLATEEWLFKENPGNAEQILYLWRNSPTIVIGRHQNPWKECNVQKMEEQGVALARRDSGGGAVYQDLGNTNWTFISPKKNYSKDKNTGIIIDSLRKFGIGAEASGRNDILTQGKKISGSAFKIAQNSALHHGTLLVDVDMSALGQYLNPDKAKLLSKGIASVKSRVMNLKEINSGLNHENICEALQKSFEEAYPESGAADVEFLDNDYLQTIPSLKEFHSRLSAWDWRFGKTPSFNHHLETRFDWGNFDLHINSKRGKIEEVTAFSDCLFPALIQEFEALAIGVPYTTEGFRSILTKIDKKLQSDVYSAMIQDIEKWLVKKL